MVDKMKHDPVEEAHFRIDELVRENEKLKRMVSPEHIAGCVHGTVTEFADRLQVGNGAVVAKIDQLIETMNTLIATLSAPTTRTSTINLPSGPVSMEVHENRRSAPWLRKPQ